MTKMREDDLERRLDTLEASIEDRLVSLQRSIELIREEVLRVPWRDGNGNVFEYERKGG